MKELNEEKLKNSSEKFRVNDVTAFWGITPRILKHYETTGILSPDRTDKNDYRAYTAEDVIKIQLAERLKSTQFTQREIAGYFSGELDIDKKYDELVKIRKLIDDLIDIIDVDRQNGAMMFSVEEEISQLCFCKTYPSTKNYLQQYLNCRDAYVSAINAKCVCDVTHTFFSLYDDLLTFPIGSVVDEQDLKDKTYRVCVPIIAPPAAEPADGTVETVTRKKSIARKCALLGVPMNGSVAHLQEEAARRGLTLTGKSWLISETGPNRKTANRTYTTIIAAEIED